MVCTHQKALIYSMESRAAPGIFLKKYEAKSNEQNSGKIGEILENGCLKTVTWPILYCKDGDIPIE